MSTTPPSPVSCRERTTVATLVCLLSHLLLCIYIIIHAPLENIWYYFVYVWNHLTYSIRQLGSFFFSLQYRDCKYSSLSLLCSKTRMHHRLFSHSRSIFFFALTIRNEHVCICLLELIHKCFLRENPKWKLWVTIYKCF